MNTFHKKEAKRLETLETKRKDSAQAAEKQVNETSPLNSHMDSGKLSSETIDTLHRYQREKIKAEVPDTSQKQQWKARLFKTINIIGMIGSIWFIYQGFATGFLTDSERMAAFLNRAGYGAPIVFIFIQLLQVVIPIIPAGVTIPIGTLVFGFWYGFFLNFVGIMVGSVIIFMLARRYGRPFVQMVLDERSYKKYASWMESEQGFERLFTYAMFIPLTPADFLCCFAGLTPIRFKKFMIVLTLSKIPTLFLYQYGTAGLLKLFIHH
ncbi:TVP38/TMEM64 family protein [Allofustis seminis]|uniref:TVP38/TMEM64 family protein n=1 Tax=Allofustis seminis TaxID=166939 RepID=UPI0003747CC6|nr:TVP38/TMEM64 family protein [Allofustis seminis]